MVVYNEEEMLPTCLDSVKDVVDEIIIVLDGPSSDRTFEIAKKYTDKVFVRSNIGHGEPHRPFTFKKARGDWILWLDADEVLSTEMRKNLRRLAEDPDVDAYGFLWDTFYGRKPIRKGYFANFHKICFFRKKALKTFYGMPNEGIRMQGNVKNTPYRLIHNQRGERNTMWYFWNKNMSIIRLHSQMVVDLGLGKRNPFFYLFKAPVWFFAYLAYNMAKGALTSGKAGLSICFQQALYNFFLYWYVFQYKLFPRTKSGKVTKWLRKAGGPYMHKINK